MTQQVLVALLGAMGVLAAALFTLAGVLYTTKTNFKLGSRTAAVAEATTDKARIEQLLAENAADRAEAKTQWEENKELRRAADLADTQHKAEKAGWEAERQMLSLKVETLLRQVERRDAEIQSKAALISRAETECDVAIKGQIAAESGLSATLKTIECLDKTPSC